MQLNNDGNLRQLLRSGERIAPRGFAACIFIFKTEKDSVTRILYLLRG
jgi:hypothetical protein